MKTTKLLATIMLAIAASWCLAQGGGGGGGQRGGGQRGGGRMQMGYALLRRTDVQDDLQLSADQKSKIDEINKAMRAEMTGAQPPAGDPSADRTAAQAIISHRRQ